MKYVAGGGSEANQSEDGDLKKIDWNDYNYPVCLKIFHYDPKETPEVLRKRVALLRINHILIIVACVWNFINNIVNAAQGVDQGGIRIAISIFLFLVWLPASFYIFYVPYQAYMKEQARLFLYYGLSGISIIWFFIWSIADFADANGWVMVSNSASENRGASAFFAVITSILMLSITIISVLNLVLFCRRDKS